MKSNRGFTLLEILVVVLIIGILVSIVLPQYKKVVEKSKATQALTLLQSIYQSAMLYQLTANDWPTSIDELSIDVPSDFKQGGEWTINIQNTSAGVVGVTITRNIGQYAGTGFSKYREHPYTFIPKEMNLCFENKRNMTPIFNGEQGSYCSKIFNGKGVYVGELNWSDVWSLP